jgi:hypothetical protein
MHHSFFWKNGIATDFVCSFIVHQQIDSADLMTVLATIFSNRPGLVIIVLSMTGFHGCSLNLVASQKSELLCCK